MKARWHVSFTPLLCLLSSGGTLEGAGGEWEGEGHLSHDFVNFPGQRGITNLRDSVCSAVPSQVP